MASDPIPEVVHPALVYEVGVVRLSGVCESSSRNHFLSPMDQCSFSRGEVNDLEFRGQVYYLNPKPQTLSRNAKPQTLSLNPRPIIYRRVCFLTCWVIFPYGQVCATKKRV